MNDGQMSDNQHSSEFSDDALRKSATDYQTKQVIK